MEVDRNGKKFNLVKKIATFIRKPTGHPAFEKALVLVDQAIVSGGNFVLGVLLARYLGLASFGEYTLLWMGVLFALNLHQAYMTQPLMSLFAGKKEDAQPAYIRSLFVLQMGISMLLAGLAAVAFIIFKIIEMPEGWLACLPLTGLLAAVYLLQDFLRKLFFVKQYFRQPLVMDLILYGLLSGALYGLHHLDVITLGLAIVGMLSACFISSMAGLIFAHAKKLTPDFIKIDWIETHKTAKEHYHYSFWLLGTSLVQWFSGNFFLIAAAGALGTVALGALRMAQNMVGLCHVLFLAMENIIPAEAARHFFTFGEKAMFAYLKRVALFGGAVVLAMLGALTLAAPWLIRLLYGGEYLPYGWLVAAYSGLYVFVYIGFPMRFALRTLQTTSPIFIAYCLSAAVSVLLAFPLVRAWGMTGVMAGLTGTQLLTLVVYSYFLHHRIPAWERKSA